MNPLWRDLYLELGVLVVAAGNLEGEVRNALVMMLPGATGHRGQLVIDGFSASQMLQRCERLAYQVLGGTLRDDFLAWLREVAEAQQERNAILHSSWSQGRNAPGGGTEHGAFGTQMRVKKARRGLELESTAYTPDDIALVSARCSRASMTGIYRVIEFQQFWLQERRGERDESELWVRASSDAPPV